MLAHAGWVWTERRFRDHHHCASGLCATSVAQASVGELSNATPVADARARTLTCAEQPSTSAQVVSAVWHRQELHDAVRRWRRVGQDVQQRLASSSHSLERARAGGPWQPDLRTRSYGILLMHVTPEHLVRAGIYNETAMNDEPRGRRLAGGWLGRCGASDRQGRRRCSGGARETWMASPVEDNEGNGQQLARSTRASRTQIVSSV